MLRYYPDDPIRLSSNIRNSGHANRIPVLVDGSRNKELRGCVGDSNVHTVRVDIRWSLHRGKEEDQGGAQDDPVEAG